MSLSSMTFGLDAQMKLCIQVYARGTTIDEPVAPAIDPALLDKQMEMYAQRRMSLTLMAFGPALLDMRVKGVHTTTNEPIAHGNLSSFTGYANENVCTTTNEPIARGIRSSFQPRAFAERCSQPVCSSHLGVPGSTLERRGGCLRVRQRGD